MAVIVIMVEERSALLANAPTAERIASAFRLARLGPRAEDGDWIGPAPRVTRTATVGERFATRAVWVYGWPAGGPWDTRPALAELASILAARVATHLQDVSSGWQPVTTAAWSEAVNGPLSWWQSGAASVTRTRAEFPTEFGRLDDTENAAGPTTDATHPTSGSGAGRRAGDGASSALPWVVGAVVVAGAGWLWWQTRAARAVVGALGAQ